MLQGSGGLLGGGNREDLKGTGCRGGRRRIVWRVGNNVSLGCGGHIPKTIKASLCREEAICQAGSGIHLPAANQLQQCVPHRAFWSVSWRKLARCRERSDECWEGIPEHVPGVPSGSM